MSKENRLNFITLAQVISMILIVLSHSVPDGVTTPYWMTASVAYFQRAGLVVFMTISGYLVTYTGQIKKYGNAGFIKRRTVRLLVPYLFVSIAMLVPKYLLRAYSSTGVSLKLSDIIYQLVTPREGILPHLWFILTLWILCLFVPLLLKTVENRKIAACVDLLFFALMFVPKATNIFAIGDIQIYVFWFYTGMLLGTCQADEIRNVKRNVITMAVIGGGILLTNFFLGKNDFTWLLYEVFMLQLIMTVAVLLERYTGKAIQEVSKYSFTIYILSLPVQNVINILMNRFGMRAGIIYISEFIAGVVLPIIVAIVVEKIDAKLGGRYIGKLIGL